jgi:hypothetical protein
LEGLAARSGDYVCRSNLKVCGIDSKRMMLRVEHGKGRELWAALRVRPATFSILAFRRMTAWWAGR